MNPPGPLLQLRDLDRTSLQFHEQLGTLLSSDEYQKIISELDGEDLTWLVEYLDDVSLPTNFPHLVLNIDAGHHRYF